MLIELTEEQHKNLMVMLGRVNKAPDENTLMFSQALVDLSKALTTPIPPAPIVAPPSAPE